MSSVHRVKHCEQTASNQSIDFWSSFLAFLASRIDASLQHGGHLTGARSLNSWIVLCGGSDDRLGLEGGGGCGLLSRLVVGDGGELKTSSSAASFLLLRRRFFRPLGRSHHHRRRRRWPTIAEWRNCKHAKKKKQRRQKKQYANFAPFARFYCCLMLTLERVEKQFNLQWREEEEEEEEEVD